MKQDLFTVGMRTGDLEGQALNVHSEEILKSLQPRFRALPVTSRFISVRIFVVFTLTTLIS
jgi:hypothetical protein